MTNCIFLSTSIFINHNLSHAASSHMIHWTIMTSFHVKPALSRDWSQFWRFMIYFWHTEVSQVRLLNKRFSPSVWEVQKCLRSFVSECVKLLIWYGFSSFTARRDRIPPGKRRLWHKRKTQCYRIKTKLLKMQRQKVKIKTFLKPVTLSSCVLSMLAGVRR